MSDSEDPLRLELESDEKWSEEDIEEFMEDYDPEGFSVSKGRHREVNNPYHAGMMWAGITLFFFMVYSLYVGEWNFALYNVILLVVLALGSKALN